MIRSAGDADLQSKNVEVGDLQKFWGHKLRYSSSNPRKGARMMFCGTDSVPEMHCDATLAQDQTMSMGEVGSTAERECIDIQEVLLVPTTFRRDENVASEAAERLTVDTVQNPDDADEGSEGTKGDEFVELPQERRSGRAPKPTERGLEYIAQRPSGVLVQSVPDYINRFGGSSLTSSSKVIAKKIPTENNDVRNQSELSEFELGVSGRQQTTTARRSQIRVEDTVLINVGNASGREGIVTSRRQSGKYVVMVNEKDGKGAGGKVVIRISSITLLRKAGDLSVSSTSDLSNSDNLIDINILRKQQQEQEQAAIHTSAEEER